MSRSAGKGWACLGEVNVEPIVELLSSVIWPPVKGGQPNRVKMPAEATGVVEKVLGWFAGSVEYDRQRACLSRLTPGQTYQLHRDPQPPEWITRVHVPVVTNDKAWVVFEDGDKVHFEAGRAYTFDTLMPHNYGNDGDTDRVHLIFDVVRNA